jgi:NADH:ubiquinone oxidoreductase subunit 2 (subunit N)
VRMYMRESRKEIPVTPVPFALGFALAVCLAATLYLGLFPSRVLQYSQESSRRFVPQTMREASSPAFAPAPTVP